MPKFILKQISSHNADISSALRCLHSRMIPGMLEGIG